MGVRGFLVDGGTAILQNCCTHSAELSTKVPVTLVMGVFRKSV
jgi:hypothetical protein